MASRANSGSLANARSEISSETVKPMPDSTETANRSAQASSGFSSALVNLAVSQVPPKTPTDLPSSRPSTTPSGAASVNTCPSELGLIATPAANSANTGTQKPAENGLTRCSTCSAGECRSPGSRVQRSSRPMATPATVAWTPLSCISAQVTSASGRYRYQLRIRSRCSA